MNLLYLFQKQKNEEDLKKKELERFIIDYINKIIKFDSYLGRSDKNFYPEQLNEFGKNVNLFKERGIRVFHGAGNMFLLKLEKKLLGWQVKCIHFRGTAQRIIKIQEVI